MQKIDVAKVVDESKCNSFHLAIVTWCGFILLCDGYDMVVFGSVISSLSAEWGLTASMAGFIGSLTLFGSLIGCLICGMLPLLALPFMIKFLPESLAFLVAKGEDQKVRSLLSKIEPSYVPKENDVFEVYLPKTWLL